MSLTMKKPEDFLKITDKCVGCTACARVCPTKTIIGSVKQQHTIMYEECVLCGQCIGVCPVGAVVELIPQSSLIMEAIEDPSKTVIIQTAPSVRATIGEGFDLPEGSNVQKKLITALKTLGFDYVLDTSVAADFTIMEEAHEVVTRLQNHIKGDKSTRLPILTSCCPAWVNFFENEYPDLLDIPSSAKSPMQMYSALIKTYFAEKIQKDPKDIVVVSLMPCLSKKFESTRPEFSLDKEHQDTDFVLSPRDAIGLMKEHDISLPDMEDGEYDSIFKEATGGGIIFGRTAGVLEAALRTAYEWFTGETLENVDFKEIRGVVGLRVAELDFKGTKLKVAVTNGFDDARVILNQIRTGRVEYHVVEIMACQGGCIGGGLHPKIKGPKEALLMKRAEVLDNEDIHSHIRQSHKNPYVQAVYKEFLGKPGEGKAHELLHTQFFKKEHEF